MTMTTTMMMNMIEQFEFLITCSGLYYGSDDDDADDADDDDDDNVDDDNDEKSIIKPLQINLRDTVADLSALCVYN
jgi:hypothetical protein